MLILGPDLEPFRGSRGQADKGVSFLFKFIIIITVLGASWGHLGASKLNMPPTGPQNYNYDNNFK